MRFFFSKHGSLDITTPPLSNKEKKPTEDDNTSVPKNQYQLYPDRYLIVLTVALSRCFSDMQFSAYWIAIKLVAEYYQQVVYRSHIYLLRNRNPILKISTKDPEYWVRTFKDSRGHFTIWNHYWEFPRVIPEGHFGGTNLNLKVPKVFWRYLENVIDHMHLLGALP